MIKVTFKKPQTFLANQNQGGCFVAKEITLNAFEIFKGDCYFRYRGLDFKIITSCIESIRPVDGIMNEYHSEVIECMIHSFSMGENATCFKCGVKAPERPKASPITHYRQTS